MSAPQAGDPTFFAELAPDAVLHASILAAPVAGAEAVRGAIRHIAGLYTGMTADFFAAPPARASRCNTTPALAMTTW